MSESLTPRMQDALLCAYGQPVRPVMWPQYPGEFNSRTLSALERRRLLERVHTGPDAGCYVITTRGAQVAEWLVGE